MLEGRRSPAPEQRHHPYLSGNFAPVTETHRAIDHPVQYSGTIPKELHGGMYVRNGGNPLSNSDLGRDAHWFDGDGMLSGVWFDRRKDSNAVAPRFINQFVLTDVLLSSIENGNPRTPILPSIATLVNPIASLFAILWRIIRSALLVLLSHLPGSKIPITRISVANTAVLYHDGRALATCESGPPLRIQLPSLETVGWFNGYTAEGEVDHVSRADEEGFGGSGLLSWMREWTTGHPKVDPATGEMLLFHCNFVAPYVHYSLLPRSGSNGSAHRCSPKLINVPVPGCSGGKMMHDFGVSRSHTVILDLPLTLTPFNLLKNQPIVAYEPDKPARFGVFPRYDPSAVRWFETAGCCIFHTANVWDEYGSDGSATAVNLLACRLTSASLVFSAGNLPPPPHPNRRETPARKRMSFFARYDEDDELRDAEKDSSEKTPLLRTSQNDQANTTQPPQDSSPPISIDDDEQCRLYYYRFDLDSKSPNQITHQYALSTIPFEFPAVSPSHDMSHARYVYGCSTTNENFGAALGKATKIDTIVKMDVHTLLARAEENPPKSVTGSVDGRTIGEIAASTDPTDTIKVFQLPPGHYAQEPSFVPRNPRDSAETLEETLEDDGYLLFYVFDESQLDENGECREDARSELWILNAKDMAEVVAKVHLPTRVPYGLHGNWFTEDQIKQQREVEQFRTIPTIPEESTFWITLRKKIIHSLG
ncbi:carotenoid oxygenase [Corynespora cassiicola Philippines]|uniref:Carotenoid oxygenase n=1 Tax=Corynespora cassiicola Philippines TaxID=1448308 RepID=A0A2T2NYN6_CORCC|nr:carotenoid oxygenase [Corynespora cassiicola Philippines]